MGNEKKTSRKWIDELSQMNIPCGPMNTVTEVFNDLHVKARGMSIETSHLLDKSGKVNLVANPLKFSVTPPSYRRDPPVLGQDTDDVLLSVVGMDGQRIEKHRKLGIVE